MNQLYELVGFSKQAHWEWSNRQSYLQDRWLLLDPILKEWRERHPAMGLKKMYHRIQPDFIGINGFIDYAMANGYAAISYKKAPKTTVLDFSKNYPNLLINCIISDINQVWVSDTTYYKIRNKWYYLTFIMDLYSRRIIGHHACGHLFAQANLETFQMALQTRGMNSSKRVLEHQNLDKHSETNTSRQALIHHSDRGTQYKSKLYTNALTQAYIRISMGRIVYDNIHVERVHQTIKGEYLIHRKIKSEQDLVRQLDEDVKLYNTERPHLSLGMKTPLEFERYCCNIPIGQRTFMKVFALDKKKKENDKSNQLFDPYQLQFDF